MATLNGKNLGKYRIIERLGRGGMADVYKAYHPRLDRYVAAKILHSHLADDSDFLTRFEREARAVANLRHPNIVQLFDYDVEDEQYYMVMEYVEGGTLKDHLQQLALKKEIMPSAAALTLFQQFAGALHYAHQQNMLHRDLKPANILLDAKGCALLADFGIAHIITDTRLTTTGALIGTPAYMAPEQGQGERATVASEVYAMGVILYEMVTGQVPYDADTPLAILLKHIHEPLPLPKEIIPNISETLERVILKAMAKNPADRFEDIVQMERAVNEVLAAFSKKTTMISHKPPVAADQDAQIPALDSSHRAVTQVAPPSLPPILSPSEPNLKKRLRPGKGWLIGGAVALMVIVAGLLFGLKIIAPAGIAQSPETDQVMETACLSLETCIAESERLISQEQHAEALAYLDQALAFVPEEEQPLHASIWCMRGDMHTVLGDRQAAIDDFLNCAAWAALNDEMSALRDDALATAAELERQQQEQDAASKYIDNDPAQIESECLDVETCREMAFNSAEQEQFEEAVHYIELALQLHPADEQVPFAHLWCHLGEFHIEMDNPEDAANDFRTCLEWTGDGPEEENLRSYALEQLNHLENTP
jgi:serine/threonine protein kinase